MHPMRDQSLQAKTVLVTGSAQRIGAVLARALHAAGANLVLHYRNSGAAASELAASLNAARPASAVTVQADLLETARLDRLVETARQAFGGLDILLNNASSFYATPLGELTERAWEDIVGSNLKAPLFLARAAAAQLTAARGLVLNIVDIHGLRPLQHYCVYSVAKAGLIMLTKSLARELAPHVRVNAVAPGPVMWPEGVTAELKERIIARTPLERAGTPEDVARAVLFFATDAPYVTGQILAVDGGRSVGW
ncbi:MAG TPA: pteridine reductase [Steroidobacteraceae bacterium]|nr:pteridine reductase [Steroidobacteraceae bacterium]